jgi:hypothetical protein
MAILWWLYGPMAYEVALKCVLRVPNTKQFFSMTKVMNTPLSQRDTIAIQ